MATDTLGLLLAVMVTAASVQDRDAVMPIADLAKQKVAGVETSFVDGDHAGTSARAIRANHDVDVPVVRHPANRTVGRWYQRQPPLFPVAERGFVVLPKRWIIERTNAWNDRPRRMEKDHDRNLAVSEAWIWLADGRRRLRRVTTELRPWV